MKKKLFALLALVMTAMTASAVTGYELTKGTLTACDIAFYIDGALENPVTEAPEGATVIVKVIAAEENWTVSEITADGYTTYDAATTRRAPAITKNIVISWYTGNENNTYQFTMPKGNVQVHVTCVEASEGLEVLVENAEHKITESFDEKMKTGTLTDAEKKKLYNLREAYRAARNVFDNPASTDAEKAAARLQFLQALRSESLM